LKIEINVDKYSIAEHYSEFDDDDYISVYNSIAKQIDEHCIGEFTIMFSKWDEVFERVDFVYDFGSIACCLNELEIFLEIKSGKFRLEFYEKNRIIEFSFVDSQLNFKLYDTINVNKESFITERCLDYQSFKFSIMKLRNEFVLLLKFYFPQGYKILSNGYYIV